jgi:HSP20 family molecular chaperone IbpA
MVHVLLSTAGKSCSTYKEKTNMTKVNGWYSYPYDKETKALLNELFGNLSVGVVNDSNVFTSEVGDAFVVTMAIPGVNREDLKVVAKDGQLTVVYQPKTANRFVGNFNRSWHTKGLDVDALTATYVDGILTVNVPKLKKAEATVKTFVVN